MSLKEFKEFVRLGIVKRQAPNNERAASLTIEAEVRSMDEIRYYRNGIKYYGTKLDMDYAKSVLKFLDKMHPKLRNSMLPKPQFI